MKNSLKQMLVVMFILGPIINGFSQDSTSKVTPYLAVGLSMSNTTTFEASSYPSIELGVMIDNISLAGVFGRKNLYQTRTETLNNYWYEAKIAYSFPLGSVSGYGLFGAGTYIGTKGSLFIEYGGGISKEFSNFYPFVQVSNWDGITYLTPGFSYSF